NIPVGVWFVREHVRAMLKGKAARFTRMDDAIKYAMSMLKIPLEEWARESSMLKVKTQMRLSDYIQQQRTITS
ncbi:MAG: hypothetical protein QXS40_01265, partial [Candidatus Nitrosocaldus sp.]